MYYKVNNESERIHACKEYATAMLDRIDREIVDCDYSEDVDGNPVYDPGAYRLEKQELITERNRWQTLLEIITSNPPFSYWL